MVLQVPVPRNFSVDEVETGSYMNSVRDALNFLVNLPIATVYQTVSEALTSGTAAPIGYDSTAVDTYSGHSNTVNPSRYTAVVPGYYLIGAAAPMSGSTGGAQRKIQMYYNGTGVPYGTAAVPPTTTTAAAVTPTLSPSLVYLNAGDFVSIYALADTTGVSVTASGNDAYMTVIWAHA